MNYLLICLCSCLIGITIYLHEDIKAYIKECINIKVNDNKLKEIELTERDMNIHPMDYMNEEEIKIYKRNLLLENTRNEYLESLISYSGTEYLNKEGEN